ncbi:MAG TPA: DUF2069 domain-containing protein [Halothiobacillus sp.]|nr:DUF2069 domain-containing protein [Halothiobacillus sp.]
MTHPTHTKPSPDIIWLRRIIFWAQPLIVICYLAMAMLGSAPSRPQGPWLAVLVLPALATMPGMWAGWYRAFVWAALADLFYLLIATTDAWTLPADRPYNLLIVSLTVIGFCAAWAQGIILRRRAKQAAHSPSLPRDKLG